MNAVTFLFGAGAEQPYGICTGAQFIEPLFLSKWYKERKSLLDKDVSNFQLIYPTSSKVYIQSICANEKEARKVFDKTIVEKCIAHQNRKPGEKSVFDEKDAPFSDWYHIMQGESVDSKTYPDDKAKQIREFFLSKAVFFDSLDEKFNDLRNDPIAANGKRIVNAYWTIFILMFTQVYDIPNDFEWRYDNIFAKLNEEYNNENLVHTDKTYYEILAESNLDYIHIATSNYTNLVDICKSRTSSNEIAFLHGKLTWFEDYRRLIFHDVSNGNDLPDDCSHLIPFIMIPSGVKPIISKFQLDEYSKFIHWLTDSTILCVVGYRFNSEDNHINAIIADWLRKDKTHKLVYFNYSSNGTYLEWTKQKWTTGISIRKIDETDIVNFNEILFVDERILDIHVTKNNSTKHFISFVKELENQ